MPQVIWNIKRSIDDIPYILGSGVYIIISDWRKVFYVGQSSNDIPSRLREAEEEIPSSEGALFYVWASVNIMELNGVERFLIEHYNPPYNETKPLATPIPVNLPIISLYSIGM